MKKLLQAVAMVGAGALLLSGCASGDKSGDNGGSGSGNAVTIGTTETVTSLDPAGAYDNGSWQVMTNVYPFLMNNPVGESTVAPDSAESAEFTQPTEYTVKLKKGLKFANGNDLTSSDVKFTFDRQLKIADPNGPSSLLANLDSVETPDDLTVVFKLKTPNDQTFPQVLSSPVAPIVDEDSFPADAVASDEDIVKANPFAGQYAITKYDKGNLIAFKAFDGYAGMWGAPKTESVNQKYFANESNLSQAIETKAVDVAFRSLSATDVEKFETTKGLQVIKGPGGEIRYLVFNFNSMPFGATTADADPAKALAVRQSIADIIDREKISTQVFKNTYTPLYSFIPEGLLGANEALKDLYGNGKGGPDVERAKKRLADAGVQTPVSFPLQYAGERYGASSAEEYAQIKSQLEATGLFKVDLQSTEWGQYTKDRVEDLYPVHQLGWFPDYSDPDNYLSPFFLPDNFLVNHFENKEITALIDKQRVTGDSEERAKILGEIQDKLAVELSTLPMLQGSQVAVAVDGVEGVTLDASFKLRFGLITK
ncbi:peptide ABC transporter substrate-binding protein [Leucobacter viscericola]|uniref:Peptide ABC transporter substrate-binding protein n=1 Tax=Leucobacter viscericola TaxID=2714935 RepID=A0A6G7XE89_9MICO|nr:ABC transporter substrate-binding protein [Leucobacter viscericola]QIK62786.1 peptide ABC transporter substrate-binding protein [Leucobacter viscericola]